MDRKEFRVLIKHCFLLGKNTVEVKQWLDKRYGDITKVHKIVLGDRKIKLREIADTFKISEVSVFTISNQRPRKPARKEF